MTRDSDQGAFDDGGEPAREAPEILIEAPEQSPARMRAGRPNVRGWAVAGIAVVLAFVIGVAVGDHIGGTRSGTASRATAPMEAAGTTPTSDAAASAGVQPSASSPFSSSAAAATTSFDATPSTPQGPAPRTAPLAGSPPLPQASGWELVGFQWSGRLGTGPSAVVRFDPSTGMLTTTPVPQLASTGPLSVAITGTAVIIRPWDRTAGYLVANGRPASEFRGDLADGSLVFPGPDANHVWVSTDDRGSLREVDLDGTATGTAITIPFALQIPFYALTPDGAGYVLGRGADGTYDLRPDGAHLVTHGNVLAAGPTGYLVDGCDSPQSCHTAVIDRDGGTGRVVAGSAEVAQGVLSPNGDLAATAAGGSLTLTDVTTGQSMTMPGSVGGAGTSQLTRIAFTPDSRYLLVATDDGVVPIDTASLTAHPTVPIPGLVAIAVRPVR